MSQFREKRVTDRRTEGQPLIHRTLPQAGVQLASLNVTVINGACIEGGGGGRTGRFLNFVSQRFGQSCQQILLGV